MRFSIDDTLHFLRPHLPPGASILEVGCGAGDVAHALDADGHRVVALDVDADRIAEARRRGVEAHHRDFLEWAEGNFDAIYFGRSFHHVFPLDAAIARAKKLLADGGTLLLEDFAWEAVDEATAEWLADRLRLLAPFLPIDHGWAGADHAPLETWTHAHAHHPPLHRGEAMIAGLKTNFRDVHVEAAPYLYRYFGELVPQNEALRTRLETTAYAQELRALRTDRIRPVGLRIVARG